jgi:hypothetical protein
LCFHPEESRSSQNNAFYKAIARHNQWRPNLGFRPGISTRRAPPKVQSTCAASPSCQGRWCKSPTPNTQEEPVQPFFITTKKPIHHYKTSDRSQHDFLNLCKFYGNLNLDISHDIDKMAKLRATPLWSRTKEVHGSWSTAMVAQQRHCGVHEGGQESYMWLTWWCTRNTLLYSAKRDLRSAAIWKIQGCILHASAIYWSRCNMPCMTKNIKKKRTVFLGWKFAAHSHK